jgi:DNA polymerase-3 subunit epsilon
MAAVAQLTLDGADRLHELLCTRRAPVGLSEAAACLFALRSAPSALVHQLVDEVVRADPRLVWRSAGEVALAEWDEVAPLLDVPLEQADYVVFDLETTGTRAGVSRIVELGAVRMSGFCEAARMQRLVDPGCLVPAQITQITGIATHHVRGRQRVGPVLDEFLRFSSGAVLVAHNARFDIGFVDADLGRLRSARLAAPVIDTVALARRLLGDRLERMNLGTLAERFDTEVRPCHRALPDALATAEVLVRLLGLAQERGAATVADVIGLCAPERRRVRTRRGLAKGVPTGPGVYLFRDANDAVLYVGKATDLRARVRSYFSGGSLRAPVERAVEAAARIETRPLGSEFEAALLELELIAGLRPPANARAPRAGPGVYLTLTLEEQVPRLRVTSGPGPPGTITAGPLRSRAQAEAAAGAARAAFGLRVCRPRLPVDDGTCLAGIIGSCHAPCRGGQHLDRYADAVEEARLWLEAPAGGAPAKHLDERMRRLSGEHRFEDAAAVRDQLAALRTAGRAVERLRRARSRSGVILAPDTDDRFVQAFACAGGRVVARRRLPRAGDGRLEAEPLLAALAHGLAERPAPFSPAAAEQARIVSTALVRPGRSLRAVAVDAAGAMAAAARVVRLRGAVPLRT